MERKRNEKNRNEKDATVKRKFKRDYVFSFSSGLVLNKYEIMRK